MLWRVALRTFFGLYVLSCLSPSTLFCLSKMHGEPCGSAGPRGEVGPRGQHVLAHGCVCASGALGLRNNLFPMGTLRRRLDLPPLAWSSGLTGSSCISGCFWLIRPLQQCFTPQVCTDRHRLGGGGLSVFRRWLKPTTASEQSDPVGRRVQGSVARGVDSFVGFRACS